MRKGYLNTIVVALLMSACLTSSISWGQAPPDAGRILQEMQKAAPPEQATEKPPIITPAPPAPPMKRPAEARLFVEGFIFSMDIPVVPESELQKVVKDYTNREATFGELMEAAEKVTNYLRGKGYFLAKAYIPQQEIANGIVKISILIGKAERGTEGKIAEVGGPQKRLSESVIQGIMGNAVKPDEALKLRDLERGVLLINDLPETTAQANLSAGSTPGTTKVALKVNEGHLITGSVGFDTFGNRYTGLGRFLGNLNINDLTGYGDQITIGGIQAGDPIFNVNKGNMWLWRVGWQMPIGYSGLKAGVAYTSLGYRVGQELSDADEHGTARIWAVNAIYPIIRTRDNNLFTTIEYDYKILMDATDDISIDNKRVNVVTLGVNGNRTDIFGGGGYSICGLSWSGGHLNLGRNGDNLLVDQQTLKTDGDYWKLLYFASRLQNIGKGFSLYGSLSGQYASKNLDTSEQFILGGPNGIRAYATGEAPGDNGVLINAEIRKDFPGSTPVGHIQAITFFDWGWIVLHKHTWTDWNSENPSLKNSYGLSGAGVGINLSKPSVYLVRAFWAAKVGPNPGRTSSGLDSDGKRFDNRFWAQGILYF